MNRNFRNERLAMPSLTRRTALLGLGATALTAATAGRSHAAEWPTRPVTIIIPYSPGGQTDAMARLASDYISKQVGQPLVADNRPGGSGLIGAMATYNAPADGYTFMFGSSAPIFNIPMMVPVKYDPMEDFIPISIFGTGVQILAIRSEIPAKTLPEFVEYVKKRPGKLNYATAGVSGNLNLTTNLMLERAGMDMVAVPYKSGTPALAGFLAGDVQMYFGNSTELLAQKDNKIVRFLGVSTAKRIPQLPDVPTVAEVFPGFEGSSWNGFYAKKGTPQEAIAGMEKYTMAAARDPEVIKRLDYSAIIPVGSTQAEFKEEIERSGVRIRQAMKAAGLKIIN